MQLFHRARSALLIAVAYAIAAMVAALPVAAAPPQATTAAKKVVKTSADLPAFTYKVPARLDRLLTSDAVWAPFAATMRTNLEGLLRNYTITDRKTLQSIELDLMLLDLDTGRDAEAETRLARVIELEDKLEAKTLSRDTFMAASILDARRTTGAGEGAAYHAALAKAFATRLTALPDSASVNVAKLRGGFGAMPPDFAITVLNAKLTSQAQRNNDTLTGDDASTVLALRTLYRLFLPARPELLTAADAHLATHPPVVADLWRERDVALDAHTNLTPVTIAVWDSGVDPTRFPSRMFVNSGVRQNGRDGSSELAADVYGLAWDDRFQRTARTLMPVNDADRAEFPRLAAENQAFRYLRAGVDNAQVRALRAKVNAMKPAQLANEERLIVLFSHYIHGTQIADVASAGNPAARILSVHAEWDENYNGMPTTVYDAAWEEALIKAIGDSVAYLKAHGVRVVNMSWGLSAEEFADNLRRAGFSKDEAELKRVSGQRLAKVRAAMQSAFADTPEILFVVAAGNSDNDASFHQSIPGTIDLPNLLTVGAVDKSGAAADFTSFGKHVALYAKGVDIEMAVPGGGRLMGDGTSFAAPQVVNLAGKLLAVNPKLTTAEVVKLIRDGATTGEDKRLVLINPKRSLELLSER